MNKNKFLKIVKYVVCAVLLIPVTVFLLMLYNATGWKQIETNSNFVRFDYHKWSGICVVGYYEWDGNEENMTITIPDEVDGKKVNSLGGTVGRGAPVRFDIVIPDDAPVATTYENCADAPDENTVTYKFTVKIGENMRYFDRFNYKEYRSDWNGNLMYIIDIDYEISPDNKWAYSKNGIIYDKKTDKPVGDVPEWQSQPL